MGNGGGSRRRRALAFLLRVVKTFGFCRCSETAREVVRADVARMLVAARRFCFAMPVLPRRVVVRRRRNIRKQQTANNQSGVIAAIDRRVPAPGGARPGNNFCSVVARRKRRGVAVINNSARTIKIAAHKLRPASALANDKRHHQKRKSQTFRNPNHGCGLATTNKVVKQNNSPRNPPIPIPRRGRGADRQRLKKQTFLSRVSIPYPLSLPGGKGD